MHTATVFVTISAAALVLAGCGADDDAPDGGTVDPTELAGRTFTIAEADGYDLVEGVDVTIAFEADRISANAGCNMMNGGYSVESGVLEVGELASTLMFCDGLMDQEQWLNDFLTDGPAIGLDGTVLTLRSADVALNLDETTS